MANSVDLGSVYAKLLLDIDQFKKSAEQAQGITNKMSKDIEHSGGVGSLVAGSFGKLGSVLGGALVAGTAAATTALVGLGVKGVQSGNQLQQLQLQMNGLTKSVELGAKAMSGAYEYAQKSPFQLPDVAATTKTLLAFGMGVDQAVNSLDLLGNISITTGVPLEAIGGIFGRVSAQGRLMGGDIQQLTENGVAVLPALQKALGKTSEEVREMASRGEIDFATFQKAMESIVDPTILEQMNNTLPRQFDRLKGSVRQLSNAFVGVSVDAVNGFKVAKDGILQAVTDLTKEVANQLRSGEMKKAFGEIGNSLVPLIGQIQALVAPVMGVIIAIAQPLSTILVGAVTGLVGVFQTALPGITVFFQALNEGFKVLVPIFQQVGQILGTALGSILTALAPAIAPIAQALAVLAPVIAQIAGLFGVFAGNLIASLMPILPPLATLLAGIGQVFIAILTPILPIITNLVLFLSETLGRMLQSLTPLIPVFVQIANVIGQALVGAMDALAPSLPLIGEALVALGQAFGEILKALAPLIPLFVGIFVQIIQSILVPLLPIVVEIIKLLANAFTLVFQALAPLFPILAQVAEQLIASLAPVLPVIADAFLQILNALLPLLPPLTELAVMIIGALLPYLPLLVELFLQLVTALIPLLPPLLQLITMLLPPLIELIKLGINVFSILAGIFFGIVAGALSVVINIIKVLVTVIVGVIRIAAEFYQAFYNAVTSILRAVNENISGVVNWFRELPGKIVDAIGDVGRSLYNVGKKIIDGLINGIKDKFGDVKKTLGDLTSKLTSWKGPASLDSKLLSGSGRLIIGSFVKGLESQYGTVKKSLNGLTRDIMNNGIGNINGQLSANVSGRVGNVQPASQSTSNSVTINGNITISNQQDADYLLSRLSRRQDLTVQGLVGA